MYQPETVSPADYARAQAIEDRLIKLIDGGENLADWYHGPDLRRFMRDSRPLGGGLASEATNLGVVAGVKAHRM